MTITDDKWPDDYRPEWRCHIHAIGVISLRFSRFEACLHDLYIRLASENTDNIDEINAGYLKLNDEKRAKAILRTAKTFTRDNTIFESVVNLMEYFEWCRFCRNTIIHGELYPKIWGSAAFLSITKPEKKQSDKRVYVPLTVTKLRCIAERVRRGVRKSAEIRLRITYGNLPLEKVHPSARDCVSATSLQKLRIPRVLGLNDRP